MICYRDLEAALKALKAADRSPGRVTTIGFFDGLHIGHQRLLGDLKSWAAEVEAEPAVVTFLRHPQEVLSGRGPVPILSREHRLLLLAREGIEATLVLPFSRELAAWPSEKFVERVLVEAMGSRNLLLGFDTAFGHRRQGTFDYLSPRAASLGIALRRAPAELLDGERVSSTLVRTAISEGNLGRLDELLGRRFSLLGRVVPGDGRGRTIGFPTANLDVLGAATPPGGVYFAEVSRLGASFDKNLESPSPPPRAARLGALVNIGRRPTFSQAHPGEPQETVEAHCLDFKGDLYGEYLEVHFLARHRDERKFPAAAALVEQIERDVEAFRRFRDQERNGE
jgi:riboflavin kinase/FMN adenylyltransferase